MDSHRIEGLESFSPSTRAGDGTSEGGAAKFDVMAVFNNREEDSEDLDLRSPRNGISREAPGGGTSPFVAYREEGIGQRAAAVRPEEVQAQALREAQPCDHMARGSPSAMGGEESGEVGVCEQERAEAEKLLEDATSAPDSPSLFASQDAMPFPGDEEQPEEQAAQHAIEQGMDLASSAGSSPGPIDARG